MTNDNLQAKIVAICMFGFIMIISFIFWVNNSNLNDELRRAHRDLDWYGTNYLHKQGGTSLWNNQSISYHLRSFDGGKNWYATHTTTNSEVIIDGPAETVYPGLMKTLQDWDNIVSYAEKNGPINPNNPADAQVLEKNGFSVIRK